MVDSKSIAVNDKKDAMMLLQKLDGNILITGLTGAGKSKLLESVSIPNSKRYHFPDLVAGRPYPTPCSLTEENFAEYDFFGDTEKTIILDAVEVPQELHMTSRAKTKSYDDSLKNIK